jgi:hypothetical protein
MPAWYVSAAGNDSNAGTSPLKPLATPAKALVLIKMAAQGGSWKAGDSAVIVVAGTITASNISGKGMIDLSAGGYPPITLMGDPDVGGTLDANGKGRVLYISRGNTVTLDAGLKLTGGDALNGGGVYIYDDGHFVMKDGEISGNIAENGAGVNMDYKSSFAMSGGSITGNKIANDGSGAGVYVALFSAFTMSGGKISGNGGGGMRNGGGVHVDGNGEFTMTGGEISGNTVTVQGGGVNVTAYGTFTLNGGTVTGNTAGKIGGGVYVVTKYNGKFTHLSGTISENSPNDVENKE